METSILYDIFTVISGIICTAIAVGVLVFVVFGIYEMYRDLRGIPYFKSNGLKCLKCGSDYTITAYSRSKKVYDSFCPFCGTRKQTIDLLLKNKKE
mgnify:CR=1 FL=1